MKATSDSTATVTGYIDPLSDGAMLVWGPATSVTQAGWNVFTLDAPFYLPPEQHLLVYCNNQDGSWSGNGSTAYWRYTDISPRRSYHCYADGAWPPTTSPSHNGYRPNMQIDISPAGFPYSGYNLGIPSIVNPVNNIGALCFDDYSPLQVILANTGEHDYDFTQDAITIQYEVRDEAGHIYADVLPIDSGELLSGKTTVIELMAALPIMYSGKYEIKVWVNSPLDHLYYDDTLYYEFNTIRLELPFSDNFDHGLPLVFESASVIGSNRWEVHSGADAGVQLVYGTNMIRFAGAQGNMARFSTRQLTLYGSVNPYLQFWYYHDASAADDYSYTDVNVSVDGVLQHMLTVRKKDGTLNGWTPYTVSLNDFTSGDNCVLIQFESMTRYAGSAQYIDSILITSEPNLAVLDLLIPNVSVCDMKNKELKVVIRATTNQAIDLSSTQLAVEIPGQSPIVIPFPSTQLAGSSYDTITLPNLVNLDTGNYTIKAYITTPVDNFSGNDTAKYVVNIRPSLSVTRLTSSSQSPNDVGFPINQVVTIRNTGNVALSNIRVRLTVLVNAQPSTILEETIVGTIAAGDSLSNQALSSTYFVPNALIYGVLIEAIGCDSAKIYAKTLLEESVNTDDLELRRIDNPSGTGLDTVGNQIYVKVTLRNNSLANFFTNIKATVELRGSNGAVIGFPYAEPVPDIPISSGDTSYTFAQAYTVPNDSIYTVTVFINDLYGNPLDNFRTNDTVRVTRRTTASIGITNMDASRISMSQNIPNPSNGTTRIDYSLPTDGEVIFHVYTISGQELFNQVVETTSGKHSIDLNTSAMAAGIYFYSMEFKGQRIVKRMSVAL
jgi:hypothetical protein